jgi:hypothetical protein
MDISIPSWAKKIIELTPRRQCNLILKPLLLLLLLSMKESPSPILVTTTTLSGEIFIYLRTLQCQNPLRKKGRRRRGRRTDMTFRRKLIKVIEFRVKAIQTAAYGAPSISVIQSVCRTYIMKATVRTSFCAKGYIYKRREKRDCCAKTEKQGL